MGRQGPTLEPMVLFKLILITQLIVIVIVFFSFIVIVILFELELVVLITLEQLKQQ